MHAPHAARRLRVTFVDSTGNQEAGVDGGGLFKDFVSGLVREGFGGAWGLHGRMRCMGAWSALNAPPHGGQGGACAQEL